MYYRRVRPFRDWPPMPREDRDFHHTQDDSEIECRGTWLPRIDVQENGDAIVLYAEMPGMQKQDIKISIRDKILELSGEKKQDDLNGEETLHRTERTFGEFCRKFALPTDIDIKKTSARFKDGILELTLPKAEQVKAKQIEIKSE